MAFEDPLEVIDRSRVVNHSLRGLLAGRPSFLVVGGPSSKSLDLSKLRQRGIWTMAVNNMAGHFHANSFVSSDPPSKFHNGIWLDPTILKFVPVPKMTHKRGQIRNKIGDDFEPVTISEKPVCVPDCPNVWGFQRRSWLSPDDTFFTEKDAAWGNHDDGVLRTGQPKSVCTMLLAIRLLSYLGSRRIYLVGCDWKMNPSASLSDNYSFGEARDAGAIRCNNDQYTVTGGWLEQMRRNGTFSKFNLEIFNCYQMSGLRAFDYVPFDLAIEDTLRHFPKEPFDLTGWYEKK